MATKTINVNQELHKKLNHLKYKFECNSIEEVIERLLKILNNFSTAREAMEEEK